MHKVQVTPLIGLPQFDGWSQVATNDDTTLTVALAVGGVNAGNVGRDLAAILSQSHPQSAAELHSLLLDILHEATTVGSHIALAASCIIGDSSLFAAYQGAVLLKRGQKNGVIINAPDSIKVIEGKHTLEDIVVLSTFQASTFLGEVQQKLGQGYDIDTTVTSLVPGLHAAAESSLSCLAFLSFDNKPVIEESPLFELELEAVEEVKPIEITQDVPVPEQVIQPTPPPDEVTTISDVQPLAEVSSPLEVKFTSEAGNKLQNKLKPLGVSLVTGISRVGSGLFSALKRVPSVVRSLRYRAQPFFSSAQYVTTVSRQTLLRFSIPLLILAIVGGSGYFFWRQRSVQQVQAAESAIEPLLQRFSEAEQKIETNPLEARAEMEGILSELEAVKNSFGSQRAAVNVVQTQLDATKSTFDQLSGQDEFSSLPVYLDLQSVQSDLLVTRADADATRAALLDSEKKQLVLVTLSDKQTQVVSLESITKVANLSLNPTSAIILGSGLRQLLFDDIAGGLKNVKEEGDSNRDTSLVGSFGPYVYVVNQARRNIYRYAPDGEAYSDPIGWLQPGQSLPYDQLSSMAIDGDIWLGTRDGQVLKLTQGSEVEFDIRGMSQPFEGAVYVFTKESVSNVYVLEPGANRLVILSKTGEFIREVKSGSLVSASAVFADETIGKAFVANGSLIYEIEL